MKLKLSILIIALAFTTHVKSQMVGEIRMFAGNFAPEGWAFCDGTVLNIADNEVLFTLIGTTYGGNGQTTFALPDFRGRAPLSVNNSTYATQIGETGGTEAVTLTVSQMPAHNHAMQVANTSGTTNTPSNTVMPAKGADLVFPGATKQMKTFADAGTDINNKKTVPNQTDSSVGGSQPHDNMKPYVCINYIICLEGIYPQQN